MAAAKVGVKLPVPGLNAERLSLLDFASVTTRVYVFLVTPSVAVTTVVMVFGPTTKGRLCDALPDATVLPFTVIVVVGSAAVGVMVIDASPLPTAAV